MFAHNGWNRRNGDVIFHREKDKKLLIYNAELDIRWSHASCELSALMTFLLKFRSIGKDF